MGQKFGDGGVQAVEAGRRINIENPVGRCGRQFLHPPLLVGGEWGGNGGEGGLDRQWVDLLRSGS